MTRADREAAAVFFLRKMSKVVSEWIESGEDRKKQVEPDIIELAALLARVRAEGAAAERSLHPPPEAAVVTLIGFLDDLQKKLNAAQDEIAVLKLPPVTGPP